MTQDLFDNKFGINNPYYSESNSKENIMGEE